MKKPITLLSCSGLILLFSVTLSFALTKGYPAKSYLLASTQASAASPQAAPAKQPQWKSRDEYDAFNAMLTEKDSNKKLALAEAFLQKHANSDFKDGAYVVMMEAYQQLNQVEKAMEAGQKALESNPDNMQALLRLSFLFPFAYKGDDPDAATKLSRMESDARHGLELLQKTQKPPNVSDEQFAQSVKGVRSTFNSALGFVALQRKDFPGAIASLRSATEDNPSDAYAFYRLGLAYLATEPRENNLGIWSLARSVALAKASQNPGAADIEKYLTRFYVSYHGNEDGLAQIITQAASSPVPPEGFKVTAFEMPAETGDPNVDAFNQLTAPLKLGGERAQKTWDALKGQPLGLGGAIDSIEKGAEPDTYLVHIDILPSSKATPGMYDIELKDSTQPNVKNLSKGDLVRFHGTIESYTATPSFVLTVHGTIDPELIPAQPREEPKPRTAPPTKKPPVRRPARRTTR